MDMTVHRESLLKPLQAVSGVVEKKQTLPILSNVLLTVKDNQLFLTGTDTEVALVGCVSVAACRSGTTTVFARKLFDICRTVPEGATLRLTVEGNYLVVRSGESSFKLNTLAADEFPDLEVIEYPVKFTLKQSQLKSLFSRTYFAMGLQDVRHYLNGTFLDISQNTIKSVAADGHRLALTTIHDERIGEGVEARVILPRKSVLELIRLLSGDADGDVTVCIAESRFQVTTSDFIFTSELINAQYPDYNRLIPQGTTVAEGEREAIKQALTRASILCNEKFRGVRVGLEPGMLRITANNSDQEQADDAVSLAYEGTKMEIGFNVAYLLDVVSAISAKTIRCIFTDPNNGVLIEATEGDHCLYVVMPMRL